jgi:hypothetical protein
MMSQLHVIATTAAAVAAAAAAALNCRQHSYDYQMLISEALSSLQYVIECVHKK